MTEKEIESVESVMEGNRVGYAYLYPLEGIDRKGYVFDMTPKNIANFLGAHQFDVQKIVLTDMLDRLILDTAGGFINNCPNQELCKQIIPALAPLQMGEADAEEFPIITRELYEKYVAMEEDAVMQAEISVL